MNTPIYDIIVYGGAFDPPHAGHVDVIHQTEPLGNHLLLVPSYRHAHGKKMAPFDLRVAWLARIAEELRQDDLHVNVETCERKLASQTGSPIYTWDLLHHIAQRERVDPKRVAFVVGEDNRSAVQQFYRGDELMSTFGIIVAKEKLPIHSTTIRQECLEGQVVNAAWMAPGLHVSDFSYYA
jgi:nicotinate-nucleotide adenylyltransferase